MNTYIWRYKDWYIMVRNVGTKPVTQRASTWLCKMISDRKSNQIKKIQKLRDQISHIKAKCEYTVWKSWPTTEFLFYLIIFTVLDKIKVLSLSMWDMCGVFSSLCLSRIYPYQTNGFLNFLKRCLKVRTTKDKWNVSHLCNFMRTTNN